MGIEEDKNFCLMDSGEDSSFIDERKDADISVVSLNCFDFDSSFHNFGVYLLATELR